MQNTTPHSNDARLDAAFDALDAKIARESKGPGALRSLATVHRRGLGLLALIAVVGAGALTLRVDAGAYPRLRFICTVGGFLLAAGALAFAVFRPFSKAPNTGRRVEGALLFGGAAGLLLAALVPVHHPAAVAWADGGAAFVPRAAACFAFGVAAAAPLLAIFWLLDRTGFADRRRGVVAAAAATLAANAALFLHCPLSSSAHLLAGHVAVAVIFFGALPLLWRRPTSAG